MKSYGSRDNRTERFLSMTMEARDLTDELLLTDLARFYRDGGTLEITAHGRETRSYTLMWKKEAGKDEE